MFHTEVEKPTNIKEGILVKYIVSYSELEVLKDTLKDIKSFANKINNFIQSDKDYELLKVLNITVTSVYEPVFKPLSGKTNFQILFLFKKTCSYHYLTTFQTSYFKLPL